MVPFCVISIFDLFYYLKVVFSLSQVCYFKNLKFKFLILHKDIALAHHNLVI